MNIINFKIEGLTCEACVKLVSSRIKRIPGIQDVKIDLSTGNASVTNIADFDLNIIKQSLVGTNYKIVD
ncbi:MAG: hypothetical protein LiPW41_179 [Parcubacteria group bacterium LiPW_41]|nr:MAG: hypothetical protein LiPW41_179 [Parcubacteria group bacterium LiPW_41]